MKSNDIMHNKAKILIFVNLYLKPVEIEIEMSVKWVSIKLPNLNHCNPEQWQNLKWNHKIWITTIKNASNLPRETIIQNIPFNQITQAVSRFQQIKPLNLTCKDITMSIV